MRREGGRKSKVLYMLYKGNKLAENINDDTK